MWVLDLCVSAERRLTCEGWSVGYEGWIVRCEGLRMSGDDLP